MSDLKARQFHKEEIKMSWNKMVEPFWNKFVFQTKSEQFLGARMVVWSNASVRSKRKRGSGPKFETAFPHHFSSLSSSARLRDRFVRKAIIAESQVRHRKRWLRNAGAERQRRHDEER